MEFGMEMLSLLFVVAVIAGWVDVIAGGGGLLTIPALLLSGMPPASAIATNKLQASVGALTAVIYFFQKGLISFKEEIFYILATLIGSLIGSWLVLQINADQLVVYLPILLILMGLYFLFSPNMNDNERKQKLSIVVFSILICPLLGFYDGFFGPGTGSLMALSFVLLRGYGLTRATANAKLLNLTSNMSSLIYFVIFGDIFWSVGVVMIVGQYIGATAGAKFVLEKGASIIKPVLVIVCFLMSLSILIRSF